MNEPAAFVLWGDHSLPSVARHRLEGRGGDHREAHNVYGLLEAKAGYESIRLGALKMRFSWVMRC